MKIRLIHLLRILNALMHHIQHTTYTNTSSGESGGSVVECRTPEREVGGSKPTAAVLCP